MNWIVKASNTLFGLVMGACFRPHYSPQKMRRTFDRMCRVPREKLLKKYPGLTIESFTLGGVPAEEIRAIPDAKVAILYLHGGAYFMGSIESYRINALRLSYRANADVVLVDYRLAPEHAFPAAVEDAKAAWADFAKRYRGKRLILAGDSAGGGLALATMLALKDETRPLPDAALLISPLTDHTFTHPSIDQNVSKDTWLSRRHLEAWSPHYRGLENPRHPYVSPVHGDLKGLPPLMFFVGDQEVLLDDSLRFAAKAKEAGVKVAVDVGKDMQHDWMFAMPWLKDSKRAFKRIQEFVHMLE